MHIGNTTRRGVTLAISAVGIAAASVALAVPASASSLDTNASVGQINAARAKLGCASLSVNPQLTAAAQGHSADMARTKNVSTIGSDKSTPDTRIAAAGYAASSTAELPLTTDFNASSTDVTKALLNSDKVKTNLANCTFTQVGFGLQAGPNALSYWTIDLARPK
ncbi:CAP domain-containing protein [Antrihabitans cavernicola]|nr:CAP domain-containing protein [Spelaeibacter cavernicola]